MAKRGDTHLQPSDEETLPGLPAGSGETLAVKEPDAEKEARELKLKQAEERQAVADKIAESRMDHVREPILDPAPPRASLGESPHSREYQEYLDAEPTRAADFPQVVEDATSTKVFDVDVTWEVSLRDNPIREIQAKNRDDAIEQYKKLCAIIATEHPFKAKPKA